MDYFTGIYHSFCSLWAHCLDIYGFKTTVQPPHKEAEGFLVAPTVLNKAYRDWTTGCSQMMTTVQTAEDSRPVLCGDVTTASAKYTYSSSKATHNARQYY